MGQLDRIREPTALPGWLATATRRECARILRPAQDARDAGYLRGSTTVPDDCAEAVDQDLLVAECHASLCEAFGHLPPCCRQLIAVLIEDPPLSYAEISARLGISVSSIGPTRRRCLEKLRRHPAIAALITADGDAT